MTDSTETQLALLGLKLDANQAETNAKLDGIIALNNEQLIQMRHNISEVEKENVELDKRLTIQESKAYKFEGAKFAIYGIFGLISGIASFVLTWATNFIHFK